MPEADRCAGALRSLYAITRGWPARSITAIPTVWNYSGWTNAGWDVTGSTGLFGDGPAITEEIRQTIKRELGITVSIGVSWNKVFAKLGSDYKKPDAVTVIDRDNYRAKFWALPASDLLYVGPATTRRLEEVWDAYHRPAGRDGRGVPTADVQEVGHVSVGLSHMLHKKWGGLLERSHID